MTIPVSPTTTTGTGTTATSSSMADISARRQLLQEAARIVDGQRDLEYGEPEDSFQTIAELWSIVKGCDFTTTDVALMMAAMKLARLTASKGQHHDSWVDLAGYAACGYEVTEARAV